MSPVFNIVKIKIYEKGVRNCNVDMLGRKLFIILRFGKN